MPSTFFGLNIAGSGLRAANASLNTTANNISNSDTTGYSRQKVVQQAANALRVFETYGCAGAGVKTLAIERIRDEFYDVKYRENEASYGEYSIKNYYMKTIQEYFYDDGKTGFTTIFTNIKTSLQTVKNESGSGTTKKDFVGTATKLVEYFNNMAANLEKLQKDVNDEIRSKVDEINSIAQEIATLNKQINVVELSGTAANELRDKRDVLVDQLSKVVDVEIIENPIYDSNDPDRETGAHRYMVKIAGGQTLVDGNDRNELVCIAKEPNDRVNQSDITGLYDIYWVLGDGLGDKFNTTNARMGGELLGLFQMRDGNNSENFYGKVDNIKDNGKGGSTVTVSVTADHLKDIYKATLSGAGTVSIGNKLYKYDGWTFNVNVDDAGNKTYSYDLNVTEQVSPTRIGKEASTGTSIDYKGVPYYMEQMNEWVRLFSEEFNEIMEGGYTDSGDPGCLMFTANYPGGEQAVFGGKDGAARKVFNEEELAAGNYSITNDEDSYYRLTAKNFSILKAITDNSELLAVKQDPESDGESQYDNIAAVISMLTDVKKLSFRGADAGEFLTCVLGDITLNTDNAGTFEENYENLRKSLDNQRLSISGVDADEEALSLVQYQNSYTLASKMISTFAEVYDRLILETGV